MSQYVTKDAILGEIQNDDLIRLTDDAPRTGSVNDTVLTQIIQNASGYIDRMVGNIYGSQLPFNPIPPSVASMALTIVCYRLLRRREVPDEKNKFYEEYKDVCQFLTRVNKGEAMLDDVISRDFSQVAYTARNTTFGTQGTNWPATTL
jgi:phage gp36-like protein